LSRPKAHAQASSQREHLRIFNILRTLRPVRKPTGPYSRLNLALIADELTSACLEHVCTVRHLTPTNAHRVLAQQRPDLLFVESAWQGQRKAWKFGIAAYPDHPARNNADLARTVALARGMGIPTVFWNKEDDVHFDRFIASALLFDHIFTVDERCVPRYRAALETSLGAEAAARVTVAPLMFAVEPSLHRPAEQTQQRQGSCFVGSYGWHVHDLRRERQDMLLGAAARTLGLSIYDRNSDRKGGHYRYPDWPAMRVHDKVAHRRTCAVYQQHLVSLNINTVEGSATMFSRRLIEIIASGGLAVTTPSLAVDALFKDYCHVVAQADEATALFERIARDGYNARDREMMAAGAEHVLARHTYTQRIETVLAAVGL
jgi:spore maturation protein CgeB